MKITVLISQDIFMIIFDLMKSSVSRLGIIVTAEKKRCKEGKRARMKKRREH